VSYDATGHLRAEQLAGLRRAEAEAALERRAQRPPMTPSTWTGAPPARGPVSRGPTRSGRTAGEPGGAVDANRVWRELGLAPPQALEDAEDRRPPGPRPSVSVPPPAEGYDAAIDYTNDAPARPQGVDYGHLLS
jgi:hypothetical protein